MSRLEKKIRIFEVACKSAGLKLTPQRMEIFRELAASSDHPSAETLHARLKKKMPMLSLDTVYRTLSVLEQSGLVNKVATVESQARFEAKKEQHHHLICDKCKTIVDFTWDSFDHEEVPDEIKGWGNVTERKAVLHGVCAGCWAETATADPVK